MAIGFSGGDCSAEHGREGGIGNCTPRGKGRLRQSERGWRRLTCDVGVTAEDARRPSSEQEAPRGRSGSPEMVTREEFPEEQISAGEKEEQGGHEIWAREVMGQADKPVLNTN